MSIESHTKSRLNSVDIQEASQKIRCKDELRCGDSLVESSCFSFRKEQSNSTFVGYYTVLRSICDTFIIFKFWLYSKFGAHFDLSY